MAGGTKKQFLEKRKPGRPREYDYEKIMKEMLDWVESEDAINFAAFCSKKKYLPTLIWRLEQEFEDFANAYVLVKMRLAERRERYLNEDALNYGCWQRYQKGYDPFLSREEDKEKDKDAARQKGVVEAQQANLVTLAKMANQGNIRQKN